MRTELPLLRFCLVLALLLMPVALPSLAQDKKSDCKKPPKLVHQPTLSKEEVRRIKSTSLTGSVAVVVNEGGEVNVEKILAVSPKEGAEILYDAVSLAKFKPRPGCGDLKIVFSFIITNDR
jgi:hypothetical protein